jgi:hypothetical protein
MDNNLFFMGYIFYNAKFYRKYKNPIYTNIKKRFVPFGSECEIYCFFLLYFELISHLIFLQKKKKILAVFLWLPPFSSKVYLILYN